MISVFQRLAAIPLGAPHNRLNIGHFDIAFDDGVLLIENGALTQLNAGLSPDSLRIVIGERRLLIDMWQHTCGTLSFAATPAELRNARRYFTQRGFKIHGE